MTISDMDVKDDIQNVEMEDYEDESSEGNNSWDIVVSKATYHYKKNRILRQPKALAIGEKPSLS
jgi:hypothetical protein